MTIHLFQTEMKVDSPTKKIDTKFVSNDKEHPIEEFIMYVLPFLSAELHQAICFDKPDGIVQRKLSITIDY